MSSPRPVGRLDPKVYRRRRAVVLLGLLVVIVVVVLIVVRPGSSKGDAPQHPIGAGQSRTPKPTTTAPAVDATTVPTTAQTAKAGDPCVPASVDVEAITDAADYGAGQQPLLSFSITNTGSVPCAIDAGTDKQVYTITSGSEKYWTSTDCQKNPVATNVLLQPGKTLTSTPIAWDRTRSDPSTCSAQRAAVPAGGASYHFTVSVGGVKAKADKQFLLNG